MSKRTEIEEADRAQRRDAFLRSTRCPPSIKAFHRGTKLDEVEREVLREVRDDAELMAAALLAVEDVQGAEGRITKVADALAEADDWKRKYGALSRERDAMRLAMEASGREVVSAKALASQAQAVHSGGA